MQRLAILLRVASLAVRFAACPCPLIVCQPANLMKNRTLLVLLTHFCLSTAVMGAAASEIRVIKDVSDGPHARNVMDLYQPGAGPKPRPLVVCIHGGGWAGGDMIEGSPQRCCRDLMSFIRLQGSHGEVRRSARPCWAFCWL